MKSSRLLLASATLALTILGTSTASAWRRPILIARPTPRPKKVDASTLVTIVKVADNSISVKGSQITEKYKIDKSTIVLINNRKSPAGDLKAGMKVDLKASGIDPTHAIRIVATTGAGN